MRQEWKNPGFVHMQESTVVRSCHREHLHAYACLRLAPNKLGCVNCPEEPACWYSWSLLEREAWQTQFPLTLVKPLGAFDSSSAIPYATHRTCYTKCICVCECKWVHCVHTGLVVVLFLCYFSSPLQSLKVISILAWNLFFFSIQYIPSTDSTYSTYSTYSTFSISFGSNQRTGGSGVGELACFLALCLFVCLFVCLLFLILDLIDSHLCAAFTLTLTVMHAHKCINTAFALVVSLLLGSQLPQCHVQFCAVLCMCAYIHNTTHAWSSTHTHEPSWNLTSSPPPFPFPS